MAPRLDRWEEELRDKGLRVIEVELGTATPLETLEERHRTGKMRFPVLHDGDGSLAKRFEVSRYPTTFLIGRAGKVVWHGYPTNNLAAFEAALKKAVGG